MPFPKSAKMSEDDIQLPIIDLSGYINPKSPEDKEKVIAEVRDACKDYGFFQVKGHGVPLETQQGLLESIKTLFSLPKEEKLKLSYLENPCRREYEASGMSMREGDAMPDSKEVRSSLANEGSCASGANGKTRPITSVGKIRSWNFQASMAPISGPTSQEKNFGTPSGNTTSKQANSARRSGKSYYRASDTQQT